MEHLDGQPFKYSPGWVLPQSGILAPPRPATHATFALGKAGDMDCGRTEFEGGRIIEIERVWC